MQLEGSQRPLLFSPKVSQAEIASEWFDHLNDKIYGPKAKKHLVQSRPSRDSARK